MSKQKAPVAPGRFGFGKVCGRWWWLGTLLIVGVALTASMLPKWFNMRGPLFESAGLYELKPAPTIGSAPASTMPGMVGHSPRTIRYIATQIAIIESEATLKQVIKEKNLLNSLGGNEITALKRMEKNLKVREQFGTDLVRISFRDEDPQLANDVAGYVAEVYRKRITEESTKQRETELASLQKEVDTKSVEVERLRKMLEAQTGTNTKQLQAKYETARTQRDQLQLTHDVEKSKAAAAVAVCIMHEAPSVAGEPVTKGAEFVSTISSVIAIPFAAIAGLILMYIAESIVPRRAKVV